MASSLAEYVASVRGQYIDVDSVFGAQCWDQWSHYASWIGAASWPTYTNAGGESPHSGFACNVHHNAGASGISRWFDWLPASASPLPGDVAFWEFGSAWYPLSHVATVLDIPRNGMLRCLTQNPGVVQIADLTMRGIIGYLRPRIFTVGAVDATKTPTIPHSEKLWRQLRRRKKGKLMFLVLTEGARQDGSAAYAVFEKGRKGSWLELDRSDMRGMAANALASQYGQPMACSPAFWKRMQEEHA